MQQQLQLHITELSEEESKVLHLVNYMFAEGHEDFDIEVSTDITATLMKKHTKMMTSFMQSTAKCGTMKTTSWTKQSTKDVK